MEGNTAVIGKKRRASDNATGRREKSKTSQPLSTDLVNAVTASDGSGLIVQKKPCKVRSDKGVKKGPRKKAAAECGGQP
ncbi:hypothetical protein SCP_0508090 [Sparassis crispa]|uniref:Uncharacterized protein n=1 Tax=Sparassis crispa TaxID=139825 RepID=A0A401GNG1_9APHY|nr:hypothetical protein SCP_0508090 [Sparassis crispa]GBE83753.1 hypothetical protein SCP_0508090 [Sparassis crispa]